ncbi:F-box protein At4g22390 [Linum perenne]
MSDHIPEEVMVNILLRLRVKDLVSCRRVSKQWLSIIDDPHFISRQLQRSISTNSNAALFLQDRESPTLYWKQNYTSDVNFFSIQIHYEPSQIMYEPSQVLLMGSCHGLVCFSLFNHPNDFVVLNPSTGERHKVIISANEERVDGEMVAYGFGYDEVSEDYKVVRIIQTIIDPVRPFYVAEINSVRSKCFSRTIPLPTAGWDDSSCKSIGVFVGGSIHWCKVHRINPNPHEYVIHSIDLLSNTYHQLQLPHYSFGEFRLDNLNVGIVDTSLSLCGALKNVQKIVIWVMEEYGNSESWKRLYYIDYGGCLPYPVFSVGSNGVKILLMLDWQKFAWCDPIKDADETILAVDADWRYGRYESIYCLESLVKIIPNQSADMKKDAYEKQLKRLADQEIPKYSVPAFIDLRKFAFLVIEDYSGATYDSEEEFYVDNEFSDFEL